MTGLFVLDDLFLFTISEIFLNISEIDDLIHFVLNRLELDQQCYFIGPIRK